MKIKILLMVGYIGLMFSCSQKTMDEINENVNDPTDMIANNLIPDIVLKSAYESTGTDIAWFTSIYIEHNAGTWNQSYNADRRIGQESNSLFNNNWNSLYTVMNSCKTIIDQTDPSTGTEPTNYSARAIAQVLLAYNLAITTDMWGECPYTEAFKGAENLQPTYDKQSDLYVKIQNLLDEAIGNFNTSLSIDADDFLYGGDIDQWIKAAYSLKARYYMRLSNRSGTASTDALTAIANGFTSSADDMLFQEYQFDFPNANPWMEYWFQRDHNSISSTFYNLLNNRNDPRIPYFVNLVDGAYVIAPIGEADQTQGGYSQSNLSTWWSPDNWEAATPMITYHELLFIKAEAEFRSGAAAAVWQASLQSAIEESFAYSGNMYFGAPIPDATTYFTNEVLPLLTPGNELNEILTQKYIGLFEAECIEVYNDYRRTGIPTMNNPNNATYGFMKRFPFALSEVSTNSANVPNKNVFTDDVWWAGGNE